MKDTKTLLLLTVSLLLIMLSVFLLWTWTYRVKAIVATAEKSPGPRLISMNVNNQTDVSDSLKKRYTDMLGEINKSIDSVRSSADSLNGNFSNKLTQFNNLKSEINGLLQDRTTGNSVELAKSKITELQTRINQLRVANTDISKENEQLHALLKQLSDIRKTSADGVSAGNDNKTANTRIAYASSSDISTSDLQLSAVSETKDNEEQETSLADQIAHFNASFTVRNNSQENNVLEIVVVVLQPDGKVLQKSTWETGTFETKEGKKIYSYKTRADFNSGETKKVFFSVSSDRYARGIYRMQVYNKGQLIATVSKTMS